MDVFATPGRYPTALSFAAKVTEALTRPAHGDHGEHLMRGTYAADLVAHQTDWLWCDNDQDVELVATKPLRLTVEYVTRRHALSMLTPSGSPTVLWPDVIDRIAELHEALMFAVSTSEKAWRLALDTVLEPWIRDRLALLLASPGAQESLYDFERRMRQAIVLCYRYRDIRQELFGDRHWTGKSKPGWLCPDTDLALLAPFDGYARGQAPTYALRLDGRNNATFTIVNDHRTGPVSYPVLLQASPSIPAELAADPLCGRALHDGLTALGFKAGQSKMADKLDRCPHQRDNVETEAAHER